MASPPKKLTTYLWSYLHRSGKRSSLATNYEATNGVYERAKPTMSCMKCDNTFVSVHIAISTRTDFRMEYRKTYGPRPGLRRCKLKWIVLRDCQG